MLVSPSFHKVLWVSVVWVVVVVGVSLVLGVLLAALFSRKFPGTSAVTGIVFTPHVVSGAAIAVVWLFIFDPNYGLARVFFELFGAESRSEEHTSELQSRGHLVCRLLLEKKKDTLSS